MSVFYIDCPMCGTKRSVVITADVDLGLVAPVSDLEALCCEECHADPTDLMTRGELVQILITQCEGMSA